MFIYWSAVVDPPSPIIGYILQMDDGKGGDFKTIFDGSFQPGVVSYKISNLVNGLRYSFRVYAANFNGKSTASPVSKFYACTAPTGFAAPTVV